MRRVLLVARRDYLAVVRTKAFIIGLVAFPILFGGGSLGVALMQNRTAPKSRTVAILDHTRVAAPEVIAAAQQRLPDNQDAPPGLQATPHLEFEAITPDDANPDQQRLDLSDRVRRGDLVAFVEIGSETLHPNANAKVSAGYYSNTPGADGNSRVVGDAVSNGVRRARLKELGVGEDRFSDVLRPVPLQNMSLIARDPQTGAIHTPSKRGAAESFVIPFVLVLLLAMIVMICASPMLSTVAEDKLQRVFELLLGATTPFELIAGKVVAAIGVSLTTSVFYISGGLLLLQGLALFGLAPLSLLPWFLLYLVAEVTMLCAMGAALGAACGSPQDAQQLVMFLLFPVVVPLFVLQPIMQQPNGPFATAMSLFPLFTPIVMMLRQSLPGGVPAWQPWAGLTGVLIVTPLFTWAAARIFRVAILMQGQRPTLPELLKMAVRG